MFFRNYFKRITKAFAGIQKAKSPESQLAYTKKIIDSALLNEKFAYHGMNKLQEAVQTGLFLAPDGATEAVRGIASIAYRHKIEAEVARKFLESYTYGRVEAKNPEIKTAVTIAAMEALTEPPYADIKAIDTLFQSLICCDNPDAAQKEALNCIKAIGKENPILTASLLVRALGSGKLSPAGADAALENITSIGLNHDDAAGAHAIRALYDCMKTGQLDPDQMKTALDHMFQIITLEDREDIPTRISKNMRFSFTSEDAKRSMRRQEGIEVVTSIIKGEPLDIPYTKVAEHFAEEAGSQEAFAVVLAALDKATPESVHAEELRLAANFLSERIATKKNLTELVEAGTPEKIEELRGLFRRAVDHYVQTELAAQHGGVLTHFNLAVEALAKADSLFVIREPSSEPEPEAEEPPTPKI